MRNTSLSNFWLRSFIHEVGATVEYKLDAIPVMDETFHILNFWLKAYSLGSRTKEEQMLVTVLVGRPWKQLSGYAPLSDSNILVFTGFVCQW